MTVPTAGQLFRIGTEDRVAIVGASRSGKSFGAAVLLKGEIGRGRRALIIDSKNSKVFDNGPWQEINTLDQLDEFYLNPLNRNKSILFRPPYGTEPKQLFEIVEVLCRWAYQNGPIIVYVDETMEVTLSASQYPPGLRALATRGGEREVSLWIATQRPKGIPLVLISEANHFFIFRLRLDDDKDRMSEASEYDISEMIGSLKKRQFLYVDSEQETVTGPYEFV